MHEFHADMDYAMHGDAQHSDLFHSSSPAHTASKTVQHEILGHWCFSKAHSYANASVQSSSTKKEVPG
jgi:hypothetical protein